MSERDKNAGLKPGRTIAEIIASDGCMEERKALGIVKTVCNRYLKDAESGADSLPIIQPQRIAISQDGVIYFLNDTAEPVREVYLPPEYRKGITAREGIAIYGLGILLLYLVAGHEKKSGLDTEVKNPVIREAIIRCTAPDSKRRFQSLAELYAFLNRELRFPRKRIRRIVLALMICLAIFASFLVFRSGSAQGRADGEAEGERTGYTEGYEAGASDAPGVAGETATIPAGYGNISGNMNAAVTAFALYNGEKIYYLYGGKLFEMDPYTKKTRFLTMHEGISSLSFQDGRLYYRTDEAILRMDIESGEEETVCDSLLGDFRIYNGILYLDDEKTAGYLYAIDPETGESRQLNAKTEYLNLNVTDEKLFYIDPATGNQLFCCDYDGDNVTRLSSESCRELALCGDKLYCLMMNGETDGEATENAPYVLTRMSTEGGDKEVLTDEPVKRFIATENGIYYIPESTGNLEWMSLDGKMRYTVCDFTVSDFNLAGRWIFYRTEVEAALYRMRINGSEAERLS